MRTTILIHTFKRPQAFQRLKDSIAKYSPKHLENLIVYDDSNFDRGLSWGRNYLVSQAKTDFVMILDDDMVFSEATSLDRLEQLMDASGNDILAYEANCNYFGSYTTEKTPDGLIVHMNSQKNDKNKYDFVPNAFIAKRTSLLTYQWDESLKMGEHFAFFYEHCGKLQIDFTDEVSVLHAHIGTPEYDKYRTRAIDFVKTYLRKKGIKRLFRGNHCVVEV